MKHLPATQLTLHVVCSITRSLFTSSARYSKSTLSIPTFTRAISVSMQPTMSQDSSGSTGSFTISDKLI